MDRLSAFFSWLLIAGFAAIIALPFAAENLPMLGLQPLATQTEQTSLASNGLSGNFTLALSWQPAFCETAPRRPECVSQVPGRLDTTHFSLHGLWPDPVGNTYCGVVARDRNSDMNGEWEDLPALELASDLRAELDVAMPGTESFLHRHEWIKHGTCSGGDASAYFRASLDLLDKLNAGTLRRLFEIRTGTQIFVGEVRGAIEEDFGTNAGLRVQVECEQDGDRRLISEIRISLSGEIGADPDLSALMLSAPVRQQGCPSGVVDPVGIQ